MFEPSCQQSKNWLLLTAFVSLDEATECFVVLKFYWFSLVRQLTDSFGSSQKIGETTFLQSHDYYGCPHKNVFDPNFNLTFDCSQNFNRS